MIEHVVSWRVASGLCFVSVMGVFGINRICAVIETPYGKNVHDLPLIAMQQNFNSQLLELLAVQHIDVDLDQEGVYVRNMLAEGMTPKHVALAELGQTSIADWNRGLEDLSAFQRIRGRQLSFEVTDGSGNIQAPGYARQVVSKRKAEARARATRLKRRMSMGSVISFGSFGGPKPPGVQRRRIGMADGASKLRPMATRDFEEEVVVVRNRVCSAPVSRSTKRIRQASDDSQPGDDRLTGEKVQVDVVPVSGPPPICSIASDVSSGRRASAPCVLGADDDPGDPPSLRVEFDGHAGVDVQFAGSDALWEEASQVPSENGVSTQRTAFHV